MLRKLFPNCFWHVIRKQRIELQELRFELLIKEANNDALKMHIERQAISLAEYAENDLCCESHRDIQDKLRSLVRDSNGFLEWYTTDHKKK